MILYIKIDPQPKWDETPVLSYFGWVGRYMYWNGVDIDIGVDDRDIPPDIGYCSPLIVSGQWVWECNLSALFKDYSVIKSNQFIEEWTNDN